MKNWRVGLFVLLTVIVAAGCQKSEVSVSESIPPRYQNSPVVHTVKVHADALEEPYSNPQEPPSTVFSVSAGDQISVLDKSGDWSQIVHQKSGKIGWINNSFIKIEPRSQWWSGDTEKARSVARRIYLDKLMVKKEYPVIHVNVDERYERAVFSIDPQTGISRKKAAACASDWIKTIVSSFPHWKNHQIFISSEENGKKFVMVMGADEKVLFL